MCDHWVSLALRFNQVTLRCLKSFGLHSPSLSERWFQPYPHDCLSTHGPSWDLCSGEVILVDPRASFMLQGEGEYENPSTGHKGTTLFLQWSTLSGQPWYLISIDQLRAHISVTPPSYEQNRQWYAFCMITTPHCVNDHNVLVLQILQLGLYPASLANESPKDTFYACTAMACMGRTAALEQVNAIETPLFRHILRPKLSNIVAYFSAVGPLIGREGWSQQ